jgi:hypothetical protein
VERGVEMGFFSKIFKKEKQKEPVKKRTFFNLQLNDIVTYDLEDYQVAGKLTLNDGGYKWYEYQLQGDGKMRWLSVEMDDELELAVYEKVNKKLTEPIPEDIEFDGVTYKLDEQGTARVQGEGRGENVNGQDVRYYDFSDDSEEKYLAVEIWGGDIEVSCGKAINDYELNILAST